MSADAPDSPIGPLADTCTGSISVTISGTSVTGTATCEWAGFGAAMWPGGHDAAVSGDVAADATVSGELVNTGAEVGTMEGGWTGCWVDGELIGSFGDTLPLEYEGMTYPVTYTGSFLAARD